MRTLVDLRRYLLEEWDRLPMVNVQRLIHSIGDDVLHALLQTVELHVTELYQCWIKIIWIKIILIQHWYNSVTCSSTGCSNAGITSSPHAVYQSLNVDHGQTITFLQQVSPEIDEGAHSLKHDMVHLIDQHKENKCINTIEFYLIRLSLNNYWSQSAIFGPYPPLPLPASKPLQIH